MTPIALTAMAWNGGVALLLWSVVFAVRGVHLADPRRQRWAWIASGVLAGLALTYRPDLVVALGLAGLRVLRCGGRLGILVGLGRRPVGRRALGPGLDISPTLLRVSASQKTDLGRVIYANSITLTPGTVSVDVEGGTILVHALSRDGAAALEEGEMDRRVTRMMGEAR